MFPRVAGAAEPDRPLSDRPAATAEQRGGDAATKRWRHVIILLIGIVGSFASIGMFVAINGWQAHVAELRFTGEARDRLRTINSGLRDATDLMWSLRAFLESMDHPVTRAEYQSFSSALRGRVVGLRDTGWAPRVTASGRDAFERDVQATGLPNFQIVERGANGKLVRAAERAEYFPILFSDPGEINRPILGFDLASESMRNLVVARARATDRPAATSPVKLMNMQRPNGGLMSFIPINAGHEAVHDASRPIAGIVLGAFETEAMIRNILSTTINLVGIDMYVFDPNGPDGGRLIYWHSASGQPVPSEALILAAAHWQGTLDLVDQQWTAVFAPSGGEFPGASNRTAIAVLAGGLIMTAMVVSYLCLSVRRTRHLETLTTNLRETTEELRRNGMQLDHIAHHDALTGLPNRVLFRHEVAGFLRRVRRGQSLAVLYLDLDRFKMVNDTFGHPVGDRLLSEVADRMRAAVREVDTITRLGGDEFAIAQSGADQPRSADTLALRLIESLGRPYDIGGHSVAVGASIGITLAARDDLDVDQLLRRADLALYSAKRDGRGTWHWFEPAMDLEAQTLRGLETDLRRALECDGFELYYQPQVSIADGQVMGFEALLRWHHPERGLVLPGDFIQCAEETGLIVPIGEWVLRTALNEASHWPVGVRVAVNLSPRQLTHDGLADMIEAVLAATGQPGARLELEITESALLEHNARSLAALRRLRALGVLIAMDNFGNGFASLNHLRSIQFDRLKIDQSFIGEMMESPESGSIVRAILRLASGLNIATTAEGVETRAQLERLAADGCGEAQGYLFSPPRPASEVFRLLAGWTLTARSDEPTPREFEVGRPAAA
jgi:diguanylate cyclase (GGDEF)-like protein